VTVGRYDWITPVDASERIVSRLRDGRLVVFERSGHSPQIEEAELWERRVRDFLHEVGADKNAAAA
jgi:proline iminopeptidase